ncbi:securin [Engraulis encrasicolus]|uniref:securin n=1 Tax=Engraulis encrasicolus TaxID=184585 RepID=UPI002FD38BB8
MNTLFASQENAGLRLPAGKDRQRLKSAPEFGADKSFKAPLTPLLGPSAPLFGSCTPLQQRLALRKAAQTPNIKPQREEPKLRCQEKEVVKPVENAEPDIEKMFPYSPDEFLNSGEADGVVYLSHLPLFGLPRLSWKPQLPEMDDDLMMPPPALPISPLPSLSLPEECSTELDDFLMTLDEVMYPAMPTPQEEEEDYD